MVEVVLEKVSEVVSEIELEAIVESVEESVKLCVVLSESVTQVPEQLEVVVSSVVLSEEQSLVACVVEQKTPEETSAYPVPTSTPIVMIATTSRVPTLIFFPGNSKLNCPECFTLTERTQSMIS